jgi:hypothetical protein
MELLESKTDLELQTSLLAEIAKSSNELRCAKQDLNKIESRLSFALVLLNELRARQS